jgi:hypothetical protein
MEGQDKPGHIAAAAVLVRYHNVLTGGKHAGPNVF